MTTNFKEIIGKILYGSLFIFVLPILLVLWARGTQEIITLPPITNCYLGSFLSLIGFITIVVGMLNLWTFGKGLPMNAFPPKKYVTNGIYKLIPHPIYFGACIMAFGISIITKSSSGFWLVSLILVLACIALIMGFEEEDMEKRYGQLFKNHFFKLPENSDLKTDLKDVIAVLILVFIPWLILYQLVIYKGISEKAISVYFDFENHFPVVEWTEIYYFFAYPFVLLVPVLIRKKSHLREFSIDFILATSIGILIQFFIPLIAEPRNFEPSGFLGQILMLERNYDAASAAFPSFHVALAFIAFNTYAKQYPKLISVLFLIPAAISISCITTGMHGIIDVLGGILLFLISVKRIFIWKRILTFCEKIANSWTSWQFGNIRIINHGIYAGLASFVGILIAGSLLGQSYFTLLLIIAFSSILGAGLWAQIIEGASGLSRPFGYYGSIIGGILGAYIISIFTDADFILMIAAFAVCSPWTQAIGRLRCFVQGCCHGKNVDKELGIRHYHEKSRVCSLSKMKGESLHPTPLYSIISNIIIGIILGGLWYSEASVSLITGLYLILSNLYRFVEEAYRGEPQTPIWNGLRLYQWTALIGTIIGAIFTTIPKNIIIPKADIYPGVFVMAIIIGLISFIAMGVDFPNSNKRFSRLAS